MMQSKRAAILLGGLFLVAACQGDVEDPSGDGGQAVRPCSATAADANKDALPEIELACTPDACTQDLEVIWSVCLEALIDGQYVTALDLNGKPVCGTYATHFDCTDMAFSMGRTACFEGYCDALSVGSGEQWVLKKLTGVDEDGAMSNMVSMAPPQGAM